MAERVTDTTIGPMHPQDGHSYECQCARCGSSMMWAECENCGGEGLDGHDCGEDCCCCLDPEPNQRCDYCRGSGGHWECMSSPRFCTANPLTGRDEIVRGTPEWYRDQ